MFLLGHLGDDGVEFIVHNKDEGGSNTSEDVSGGTLEEGSNSSFILVDLAEAISSTVVHKLSTAGLHHEPPPYGVKGVRHDSGGGSNYLGESELDQEGSLPLIFEQKHLSGIVATEVAGSVGEDSQDGDTETRVQALESIRLSNLGQAVVHAGELTLGGSLADIGGQSSPGEIKGVDESQGSGSSESS